jgi:hypothetical protein
VAPLLGRFLQLFNLGNSHKISSSPLFPLFNLFPLYLQLLVKLILLIKVHTLFKFITETAIAAALLRFIDDILCPRLLNALDERLRLRLLGLLVKKAIIVLKVVVGELPVHLVLHLLVMADMLCVDVLTPDVVAPVLFKSLVESFQLHFIELLAKLSAFQADELALGDGRVEVYHAETLLLAELLGFNYLEVWLLVQVYNVGI